MASERQRVLRMLARTRSVGAFSERRHVLGVSARLQNVSASSERWRVLGPSSDRRRILGPSARPHTVVVSSERRRVLGASVQVCPVVQLRLRNRKPQVSQTSCDPSRVSALSCYLEEEDTWWFRFNLYIECLSHYFMSLFPKIHH